MSHRLRDLWVVLALAAIAFFVYAQFFSGSATDDGDTMDDSSIDDSSSGDDDMNATVQPGSTPSLVTAWAKIITDIETRNEDPTTLGMKNNNPGNLVYNGTYAKFSSFSEGLSALYSDLEAKLRKYPDFSILDIMKRYAPGDDGTALNKGNNPTAYAQSVANYLSGVFGGGISTSTTLSQLQQIAG